MSDRTANRRQELRCYCSRSPLLAVYGIDSDGQPFIHVKIYKQHRIFGEFVFKGGVAKIFCRECVRWHVITIRPNVRPRLIETQKPVELEAGADNSGVV